MDMVTNFLKNIGMSAWWKLMYSYGVGNLSFGNYSMDAYSAGYRLARADVGNIVRKALRNGDFASSTDAIYVLMTSR